MNRRKRKRPREEITAGERARRAASLPGIRRPPPASRQDRMIYINSTPSVRAAEKTRRSLSSRTDSGLFFARIAFPRSAKKKDKRSKNGSTPNKENCKGWGLEEAARPGTLRQHRYGEGPQPNRMRPLPNRRPPGPIIGMRGRRKIAIFKPRMADYPCAISAT